MFASITITGFFVSIVVALHYDRFSLKWAISSRWAKILQTRAKRDTHTGRKRQNNVMIVDVRWAEPRPMQCEHDWLAGLWVYSIGRPMECTHQQSLFFFFCAHPCVAVWMGTWHHHLIPVLKMNSDMKVEQRWSRCNVAGGKVKEHFVKCSSYRCVNCLLQQCGRSFKNQYQIITTTIYTYSVILKTPWTSNSTTTSATSYDASATVFARVFHPLFI